MENTEKRKNESIVTIILAVLLLCSCGYICYDKLLKKESSCNCPKCQECATCQENTNLEEKVNSLKEITVTTTNQSIKIGNKTYSIKTGTYDGNDGYLSINNNIVDSSLGNGKVHFERAYLTDKFMFVTGAAQEGELIQYALGENGAITINDNNYSIGNIRLVDGYLHATGHVNCMGGYSVDDDIDENCQDKDLLIKYSNNTLTVTEAK